MLFGEETNLNASLSIRNQAGNLHANLIILKDSKSHERPLKFPRLSQWAHFRDQSIVQNQVEHPTCLPGL
jgi:hypothetical protein